MKGCSTCLALDHTFVAIVIETIGDHRRLGSTGDARTKGILCNLSTQTSIEYEIGSLEHGLLLLLLLFLTVLGHFIDYTVIGNDSTRQS